VEDPDNNWAGLVATGDAFVGSYTFDPTVPDSWPDNPKYGLYTSEASVFSLVVGNWHAAVSGSNCGIGIRNVEGHRSVFDITAIGFESMGMSVSELVVNLSSYDGSVFTSDALPTSPPPLELFRHRSLDFQAADRVRIRGVLESLVLAPEPSSLLLYLLAGGSAFRRAWRVRSRRF